MILSLFFLMFSLLLIQQTFANPACTICTITIGATLSIARYFGVADEIVGLWAGAMLTLVGYWTIVLFNKKNWNFKYRDEIIMILSISMIGFMYLGNMFYNPKIILFLYIDPFLLSTIIGSLLLIYSNRFYQWMKAKNNGHAHFPFEKVAVPVLTLIIASVFLNYFSL